jgi:hypothetical protein
MALQSAVAKRSSIQKHELVKSKLTLYCCYQHYCYTCITSAVVFYYLCDLTLRHRITLLCYITATLLTYQAELERLQQCAVAWRDSTAATCAAMCTAECQQATAVAQLWDEARHRWHSAALSLKDVATTAAARYKHTLYYIS